MLAFEIYQHCIATCLKCAAICNYAASSCIDDEDAASLAHCVQLTRECSYLCNVTAQVMSIGGQTVKELCETCEKICKASGDEASKFDKEYCRLVEDICRRTVIECQSVRSRLARIEEKAPLMAENN